MASFEELVLAMRTEIDDLKRAVSEKSAADERAKVKREKEIGDLQYQIKHLEEILADTRRVTTSRDDLFSKLGGAINDHNAKLAEHDDKLLKLSAKEG